MHFTKVHGLGNDFVLVNCLQNEAMPSDLSALGKKLCHRYFGIGADGLVLILSSKVADVRMQIINSDGSEAEMCGNVIRCVAKYLYEHQLIIKEKITVETLAGIMKPELILDDQGVKLVKVDMGEAKLKRSQIPVLGDGDRMINEPITIGQETYHVTGVSVGNPHCVVFVPDVDAVSLQTIGPKLESHPMFPKKTNVEFVQVLNRQEVRMNVWERGAGATMACGTGSCATLVACVLNNLTDKKVTVHLYAGDLIIEWAEDNHIYMTGPATEVYSGDINII